MSSAEINDTSWQTFVHGHKGFAGERVAWMETRAEAPRAPYIAKRLDKSLPQHQAACRNVMWGITPALSRGERENRGASPWNSAPAEWLAATASTSARTEWRALPGLLWSAHSGFGFGDSAFGIPPRFRLGHA